MKCWHLRYRKSDVEVNHSPSSTSDNLAEESDISADNNANDQTRESSVSRQKSRMINKMLYVLREIICCLIAAIITTYAAYHSGYSKISTPPAAMPFFTDDSVVTDWFRGELRHAVTQSLEHDISFIMYYAPWDAESQNARKEFNIAANFYHRQVFFAAVNCWQPNGECNSERNRHGVKVWPGLVAHRGQRVVIYRGPNTAPYYIRFIQNLMNPLQRVTSRSDLIKLVQKHDAVIYATVANWTDYAVFYKTALKLLEIDPMREVAVAVSTSPLLDNQTQTPFLQLITANGTVINTSQNWTVSYLLNWALKYIHRPIGWISPTSLGKSHAIASFLKSNPTLFVFTPRNPFQDYDYYYQIIRWIALQYYDCEEHRNDKYFMDAVFSGLKKYQDKMNWQYKQCLSHEEFVERDKERLFNYNIYTSTTIAPNFNKCLDNNFISKPTIHGYCSVSKPQTNNSNSNFEQDISESYSSTTENDIFSSNNLLITEQKQRCRFLFASRKFFNDLQMKDIKNIPVFKSTELKGLACKTNVTLALSVIDSLKYTSLANALGVDILSAPEKTSVIIVDAERESHYLMNKSFTYENLIEFITNFTLRNITRNILSRVQSPTQPSDYTVKNQSSCQVSDNSVCIQELTTDTFLSTIMTPEKAFVVLYFSSGCGMCTEAARIFLRLARLFQQIKLLNFVRIDGEVHSLPWEYDMPQYPTILFIPSKRKADSRVFPYEMLPTTSNLIIFVLTNLEPSMRLQALWILCNKAKLPSELESCTAYLRLEVAKVMKQCLKRWRRIRHLQTIQSKNVLKELKYLRLLYALLGNVGVTKYQFINNIIDQLLSFQKLDEKNSR